MDKVITQPAQLTDSRKNNFDFLRVLFAVIVILSHAKLDLTFIAPESDHKEIFLGPGRMALNGFFIISGFLITNSYLHSRSIGDYLKKRALRIYPGLIVSLLFCLLVVGPLDGANLQNYFQNPQTYSIFNPAILRDLGTLPGVFVYPAGQFITNVPIWSIRFEIACYLMVVLLGVIGLLRYRGAVLALFLATMAAFTLQVMQWPHPWSMHVPYFGQIGDLPRLVTFFLAGALFYLYREKIPLSTPALIVSLVGFALSYKFAPTIGLPIFFTYLIFYTAFCRSIPLQNFAKNGDFSYGLYVYAWPVMMMILYHYRAHLIGMHHGLGRIALTGATLVLTFCCAWLSWHLIEKPFLRLKSKRVPVEAAKTEPTPLQTQAPEPTTVGAP